MFDFLKKFKKEDDNREEILKRLKKRYLDE
jgi:hypothetical protein